jgi:hypothetical protein
MDNDFSPLLGQLLEIRKEQLQKELKAIQLNELGIKRESENIAIATRIRDYKAAYGLTWREVSDRLAISEIMLKKVCSRDKQFSDEALKRINSILDKLFGEKQEEVEA